MTTIPRQGPPRDRASGPRSLPGPGRGPHRDRTPAVLPAPVAGVRTASTGTGFPTSGARSLTTRAGSPPGDVRDTRAGAPAVEARPPAGDVRPAPRGVRALTTDRDDEGT